MNPKKGDKQAVSYSTCIYRQAVYLRNLAYGHRLCVFSGSVTGRLSWKMCN